MGGVFFEGGGGLMVVVVFFFLKYTFIHAKKSSAEKAEINKSNTLKHM